MKEYRLHVKVKNNYLFTVMERAGYWSVSELCHASGLHQTDVGRVANLKVSLYNTRGEIRPIFTRLSRVLRCLPEDLIPPQHSDAALPVNTGNVEISFEEIQTLLPGYTVEAPLLPDAVIEQHELAAALESLIDTLTPREKRIIERRFGLDGEEPCTLEVLGKEFGVTRDRIRQIEQRALRRLKHPRRNFRVRALMSPDTEDAELPAEGEAA